MKHKVSELEGALLDAAVALAESDRLPDFWRDPEAGTFWEVAGKREWAPSSRWDQGGPIIERERIGGSYEELTGRWHAEFEHDARPDGVQRTFASGPTMLVAAMRAYISSKFGDEVELP